MKLKLQRMTFTEASTIGTLFVDGKQECYTLEDVVRKEKVFGKTAIPAGTYKIQITFSPRFQRNLPLLSNVPGFDGIRIHPGNTAEDTDGCLLVGTSFGPNRINNSCAAFDVLFEKLKNAKDIIVIEIV